MNIKSDAPDEPRVESPFDLALLAFLALAVLALALPYVAISLAGVYWGALAAVVVFMLWISVMPVTCMSGGLLCALVAMIICLNTLGIMLAAAIRFVVPLFS